MSSITKNGMLATLPVTEGELRLRSWTRADVDILAEWPPYAFPFALFRLSYSSMTLAQRDETFIKRNLSDERIVIVGDVAEARAVVYLALMEIDWDHRMVGNMGFRVHPEYCDKHVGTRAMRLATHWCFANGMEYLRLDVAASNCRAIRCYQSAGFAITGETWRDDPNLLGADIHSTTFDFLRPHVRIQDEMPQVRFFWMETKQDRGKTK